MALSSDPIVAAPSLPAIPSSQLTGGSSPVTKGDDKVARTALPKLEETADRREFYTTEKAIVATSLQCAQLLGLVNQAISRKDCFKEFCLPGVRLALEKVEDEVTKVIQRKRKDIETIVTLHIEILANSIIFQHVKREEIGAIRFLLEQDFEEIAFLLSKRNNMGEMKTTQGLTSYEAVINHVDIQKLLTTLNTLTTLHRQLQVVKQQFEAISYAEYTEDQKQLIAEMKSSLYQSFHEEFEKIKEAKLPRVRPEDMGTPLASLLSALTPLAIHFRGEIGQQLQLEKSQVTAKPSQRLNLLNDEFNSNQALMQKLIDIRELNAKVAAFHQLIKAENKIENTLSADIRKELLAKRQLELEEFRKKLSSFDSLNTNILERIDFTKDGITDLETIYKTTQTALATLDAKSDKPDDFTKD